MSVKLNKVEPIYKGFQQTRTEMFMRFLLKICYFPGIFDKEKMTITFKLWSRQTVVHVLIYLFLFTMLYCINTSMLLTFEELEELIETKSFVELASLGISLIGLLAICMPLLIFKNFDNMNIDFLKR